MKKIELLVFIAFIRFQESWYSYMGSLDDTDNHNESYPIPIPTSGDTVKSFPSHLNHVSPCTCAATGNNETNVWIKYFCYGKDVEKKQKKSGLLPNRGGRGLGGW